MPFTMAVMADNHLPVMTGTTQEACLDWALTTLAARSPDLLVVAGDVTAAGALAAATAFRHKLDCCGLPYLITPGNSDLRNPSQRSAVLRALATAQVADYRHVRVVLLDTCEGQVAKETRLALEETGRSVGDRALVVVTHIPPEMLAPESRRWCESWIEQARPSLIVAAHSHRDRQYRWNGAPVQVVRGLDPDKAIGGPPAVAIFELSEGAWTRTDLSFPGGTVDDWSPAEREECGALLGLGCSRDAPGGLLRAAAEGVPCVELRARDAVADPAALGEALTTWRAAGGRYLSWHMPDVPWPEDESAPTSVATWPELLCLGLQSDVQALTVHVPRAPVKLMQPGSQAWRSLADAYCRLLEPAAARGVRITIENMHMAAGEAPDNSRRYGYLPAECLAWIEELRSRLGREAVGMLLDLGHARNNDPFAAEFTLGAWYALVGREAAGYHLHQVITQGGRMSNHQPVTDLHGPLISFSSFLWAWHTGQLNHAPVFVEVPGAEGQQASLHTLRRMLTSVRGAETECARTGVRGAGAGGRPDGEARLQKLCQHQA
jgi:hypothetical protein